MSAYQQEIDNLIDEAERLPNGSMRVSLYEKAVQLADAAHDLDAGNVTRKALIEAATFHEEPEKALVAFTWRLAQSDQNPERFPAYELLWEFKWVVGSLDEFPEITWERILTTIDDMERRYRAEGAAIRAPFKLRANLFRQAGMKREENAAFKQYQKQPDGWPSDCEACEYDDVVVHHLHRNEFEQARFFAEQIFQRKMTCRTVPLRTYCHFLLPLLQHGFRDQAADYHARTFRQIMREGDTSRQISEHLKYLGKVGKTSTALRSIERFFHRQSTTGSPHNRWTFLLGVRFFLRCVPPEQRNEQTIRVSGPSNLPTSNKRGRLTLAALLEWCETELQDLARRFDARNKTKAYLNKLRLEARQAAAKWY